MTPVCPTCGGPIRTTSPAGQCSRCLLGLGRQRPELESTGDFEPLAGGELLTRSQVRHFGDYELIEEIARGGMGVVFRARQISLNRPVALKMILAGQLATPELVTRFEVEAKAAASLDHPNIVPIYEVGEQDGSAFFSMRFVPGATLGKYQSGKPLPAERAARLLVIVARAIQHAHERGVLHRDIKPGNILLDSAGEPHVTDFGLAKLTELDSDLTRSFMALGTPAYMSPEQASGRAKEITTAADVYGLGAVLFEALTGEPPFSGESPIAVARRVIDEEAPNPATLNPDVPLELATICLKCLEKEPQRRYLSAAAFADDLERWLRHEPIEAHAATTWERARKWVRRKPLHAALAVTVVIAVAALLAGLLWHNRRIRVAQLAAERANRDLAIHLRQVEWQQAEDALDAGRTPDALSTFARFLRETPGDTTAASRLMSLLETRAFPLPALPPLQHGVPVNLARMDSTGIRLFTVADDGALRAWNLKTGALEKEAKLGLSHDYLILLPDGKRLLVALATGRILLWDHERWQLDRELGVILPFPFQVALSSDGQYAALNAANKRLQLWNTVTGSLVNETNAVFGPLRLAADLGPEGQTVVQGDPLQAWLWRPLRGELVRLLGTNEGPVSVVCDWRRQRAYFCLENIHGTGHGLVSFNLETGRELQRNPNIVPWHTIRVSPDGKRLVVSRWGLGIAVLDAETLSEQVSSFANSPTPANFSADDGFNVGYRALHDGTGRLYDLRKGQALLEPIQHEGAIVSHQLSPDGSFLVTASQDGTARLWDLRMRSADSVKINTGGWINGCSLAPDERRLALALNNQARIYDVNTGQQLGASLPADDTVFKANFSKDGRFVALALFDNSIRVLDGATARELWRSKEHTRRVWLAVFSHDGRLVASSSEDGTARVYAATTGRPLFAPLKHESDVVDVSFHPGGTLLATASVDSTARLWKMKNGAPAGPALRHQATVWTAKFNADGRYLVTASSDRTAQVWDVETLTRAAPPIRSDQGVLGAVFSQDGERVLISTLSDARIFDARTSQPLTPPMRHANRVWIARFSPDNRWVATASEDGTARIWDAQSGFPVTEPLRHRDAVTCLSWFADNKRLLTGGKEGTVRIWRRPEVEVIPEWLPQLAEALAGKQDDGKGGRTAISTAFLDRLRRLADEKGTNTAAKAWLRWFLIERLQSGR